MLFIVKPFTHGVSLWYVLSVFLFSTLLPLAIFTVLLYLLVLFIVCRMGSYVPTSPLCMTDELNSDDVANTSDDASLSNCSVATVKRNKNAVPSTDIPAATQESAVDRQPRRSAFKPVLRHTPEDDSSDKEPTSSKQPTSAKQDGSKSTCPHIVCEVCAPCVAVEIVLNVPNTQIISVMINIDNKLPTLILHSPILKISVNSSEHNVNISQFSRVFYS